MKHLTIQRVTLFLACMVITACERDFVATQYTGIQLATNLPLRAIEWINDSTAVVCGGQKGEGVVFRTGNSGQNWQTVMETPACLYDTGFANDTLALVCGERFSLFVSDDKGYTWYAYEYPNRPWYEDSLLTLRQLQFFSLDKGFVAGGDRYYDGVLCQHRNPGSHVLYELTGNEMASIFAVTDRLLYAGGYGLLLKSTDGGQHYEKLSLEGDYFTALFFWDAQKGVAAGYNGGIYITSDGGNTWHTTQKSNTVFDQRQHFNALAATSDGWCFAVGNSGLIMRSTDFGHSWQQLQPPANDHLFGVSIRNEKVYLTSENGKLFVCALD